MHCRFECQDRHLGRLDTDMAKHLLVGRLDALRREHRRDAARLVGHQRHRTDIEPGAAIHRAGAGKDPAPEAHDPPIRGDRRLAGKTDLAADRAVEECPLARRHRGRCGLGIDDHADHCALCALRN